MLTRAIGIGVGALVACAGALGQSLTPVAELSSPRAGGTPGWGAVLQVEKERSWDVNFKLRGTLIPEDCGCPPTPGTQEKVVTRGVFALPVVTSSATQSVAASSVVMGAGVSGASVVGKSVWLDGPSGLEQLRAMVVEAPAGSIIQFEGMKPKRQYLNVDLDMSFRATARSVKVDEGVAGRATWPATWPVEAAEAMGPSALRDNAVVPDPGFLRALDKAEMERFALQYAKLKTTADARKTPPFQLAKEVATALMGELRLSGDGLEQSGPTKEVGTRMEMMPRTNVLPGGFAGVRCRDALTILRSKGGNPVEGAVALSAVYQQLGLPSRVMIGFEAENQGGKQGPKMLATPRLRAWVEFALYDANEGLAWVPVELKSGRGNVRVGSIEGGDTVVVLASNLWPPSIREVGKGPCLERNEATSQTAGLWGFWTTPAISHGKGQELWVTATPVARPRRAKQ